MSEQWWNLELDCKPDFEQAMKRIYAWYEGEMIDRAPIRFHLHNSEYDVADRNKDKWATLKDRWFDTEYQVNHFMDGMKEHKFLAETFPVFWPNLGPNAFSSFYGCPIEFGEVTSWARHFVNDIEDANKLRINLKSEQFLKLEELTNYALSQCEGKFLVGYTDLHAGLDFIDAVMGTEEACLALYDSPALVKEITNRTIDDFFTVYNHFDNMIKAKNQPSSTWMGIPSFGKMHIPSCDFSAMISTKQFEEFYMPLLRKELLQTTHNVFHLDGKDVAKHVDLLLDIKEINAIQWVQGVGDDEPIMQWLPFIKKLQASDKALMLDMKLSELDEFMSDISPKGIMLCLSSNDENEQREIIRKVEKWR
jgi:hypothetical protein